MWSRDGIIVQDTTAVGQQSNSNATDGCRDVVQTTQQRENGTDRRVSR